MANVNRPSGFSPVKSLIGGGFVGQGNLYCIPNDASNTYAIGDVVMSLAGADGTGIPKVVKWGGATTTSALPLGIITGFATPPVGTSLAGVSLTLEKQWIPKSDGTQYCYVADDPFLVFEAQFDVTGVTAVELHMNSAVTINADQTGLAQSAPLSDMVLTAPAVTATLPVRLMGLSQEQNNDVGAYAKVLCKWNYHEYGVTSGASGSVVSYLAP